MNIFGLFFVPLPVILLAVAAGLITFAALLWWQHRQQPQPAQPPELAPEEETGIVIPPTLPKVVGPYGLGILISSVLGLIFTLGGYFLLTTLFPNTYAPGSTSRMVALGLLLGIGVFICVITFLRGIGAPPIPVGYRGVPLFFKARPWIWARFLLPEGVQWGVPYLLEYIPVDMRARPLVEDSSNPDNEVVVVEAQAKAIPPDVTTDPTAKESKTIENIKKVFEVPVKVYVAARVRTFNPYRRINYDNPDGIMLSALKERVREFVRSVKDMDGKDMDAFALPDLKEEMTRRLNAQLDETGIPMGTDFIKLFVTEITLPESLSKEGEKMLNELVQRASEKYQAETLAQTSDILRQKFPSLEDKELKNMVLTAAGLATTQTYSFEGQGPLPVVPLGTQPKGSNDNGSSHH